MENRPSIILIREWEQQMSSSGCCSRFEGDFLAPGGEVVFPERRATMESLGPLYQAIKERYRDAVEVNVVDPRNLWSLLFFLVRDARRHGAGIRGALGTLARLPVQGVVVNGRLIARGEWPAPERVFALLGPPELDLPSSSSGAPWSA